MSVTEAAGGRSGLNHQTPRSSMRICSSRAQPCSFPRDCCVLASPCSGRSRDNLRVSSLSMVPLERNQIICMYLEAKLWEEDYIWRWTTRLMPPEGSNASPLEFEQSTLGGAVLSPEHLHRIAADYVPQLSEEGLLRRRTFELMDGRAGSRVPKTLLEHAGSTVVRRRGFALI
jgi:hypothetical protein